ncbi:ABC transporter permease [Pseudomonas sp. NY15349]|jgi:peptide/nickel transport system permease protein|uniref:ABC transporter permease n=1 Tax=unclassified Pseudomonas TaxID=196821 RepID=UPI001F2739BC|nr:MULTISPECIES: ABC transporter permease [unclassified Pseudomonas]MCE5985629.1 ABC transporter permease [Pseudomonas sp. LM20]MCE5990807.1 ABC transporter permease [Pseudomonas sp. KCA11]UMY60083.1 ABC transporter permease [Pseudomonas sp. LS.1a]
MNAIVSIPDTVTSRWQIRPGLTLAWIILGLILLAVTFPDWLSPTDPLAADARLAYHPPGPAFWLGSDENGRDVLSRLIHGARPSLYIGLAATLVGLGLGTLLGLLAGLAPAWLDNLLMRAVDVLLAFPDLLLALVIITLFGQGTSNLILAVGIASVPRYARLVRAQALTIRRASFVEAAVTLGRRPLAVVFWHVLPNAVQPVLILACIGLGGAITAAAALSFLGFGAPPPAPEWGAMMAVARNFMANAPWLMAWPALAITLTVISITVIGRDWLRRSEGRNP